MEIMQNYLRKYKLQHTIKHTDVNCFKYGEEVFFKSNPEWPMIVFSVNEKSITTMWQNKKRETQTCEFPPETLLQYKYNALVTYNERYKINLN